MGGETAQPTAQDAWMAHPAVNVQVSRFDPKAKPSDTSASTTFNDNWEGKPYDLGSTGYVEGSIKWKVASKVELLPKGSTAAASEGYTTNQGVKGEVELAKNKLKDLLGTFAIKEDKATFNHEISAKQIKISVAYKLTLDIDVSWLTPVLTVEFVVASVDWAKFKANPDSCTAIAIEGGGSFKGSGTLYSGEQWDCKASLDGGFTVAIKPNWKKIITELIERFAPQLGEAAVAGGTGGVGAAAVAAAPVAGVAGGILGGLLLCAGCMKAIAVMGEQGRDSTRCAQEGARLLRLYADSYAATVRGGSGPSKEGNQDGEAYLDKLMKMMKTSRADAVDMCKESDQKYEQIAWAALRPQMREAVKKAYAELHYGDIHGPSLQEFLGDNSNY